MTDQPDNIIDLMPYIEGQKFNWTVDMTHALLKQGPVGSVGNPSARCG